MLLTRVVLRVAAIPLLSGCVMLGGMGHRSDVLGSATAVDVDGRRLPAPLHRAETSSGGLALALSFPTPRVGAAVAIDAQLRTDGAPEELNDGDVWLRIRTPGGNVDQFRMQRLGPSAGGTYRARYRFPDAGFYLVMAEARTGTGPDARTVLVTTELEVRPAENDERHDWLVSPGTLGGLGMIAAMAVMMAGSLY